MATFGDFDKQNCGKILGWVPLMPMTPLFQYQFKINVSKLINLFLIKNILEY